MAADCEYQLLHTHTHTIVSSSSWLLIITCTRNRWMLNVCRVCGFIQQTILRKAKCYYYYQIPSASYYNKNDVLNDKRNFKKPSQRTHARCTPHVVTMLFRNNCRNKRMVEYIYFCFSVFLDNTHSQAVSNRRNCPAPCVTYFLFIFRALSLALHHFISSNRALCRCFRGAK